MMTTYSDFKIPIKGDWDLEDLYIFPRNFEQVYYFFYTLNSIHNNSDSEELYRQKVAFSQFPWQGGYSAVNFYNKLKYIIEKKSRPRIKSLKYNSPGWIEISAIPAVILTVSILVKNVAGAIRECNLAYSEIHKEMSKRKILRVKHERELIKLEKDNLEFINYSVSEMIKILGIKSINEIHKLTGSKIKTLKVLLSIYRRIRTLSEFENKGKTNFRE